MENQSLAIPSHFSRSHRNGQEVLTARPAWSAFIFSNIALLAIIAGNIFIPASIRNYFPPLDIPSVGAVSWFQLGSLAAALPIIGRIVLMRWRHRYEIIDRSEAQQVTGIASQVAFSTPLLGLNYEIYSPFLSRILGFGTIAMQNSANNVVCRWWGIKDPHGTKAFLKEFSKSANRSNDKAALPTKEGSCPPRS